MRQFRWQWVVIFAALVASTPLEHALAQPLAHGGRFVPNQALTRPRSSAPAP